MHALSHDSPLEDVLLEKGEDALRVNTKDTICRHDYFFSLELRDSFGSWFQD